MPKVSLLVDGSAVLTADYTEHIAGDVHPTKQLVAKFCDEVRGSGCPEDFYRAHPDLRIIVVHAMDNRAALQIVERDLTTEDERKLLEPYVGHLLTTECCVCSMDIGDRAAGFVCDTCGKLYCNQHVDSEMRETDVCPACR